MNIHQRKPKNHTVVSAPSLRSLVTRSVILPVAGRRPRGGASPHPASPSRPPAGRHAEVRGRGDVRPGRAQRVVLAAHALGERARLVDRGGERGGFPPPPRTGRRRRPGTSPSAPRHRFARSSPLIDHLEHDPLGFGFAFLQLGDGGDIGQRQGDVRLGELLRRTPRERTKRRLGETRRLGPVALESLRRLGEPRARGAARKRTRPRATRTPRTHRARVAAPRARRTWAATTRTRTRRPR